MMNATEDEGFLYEDGIYPACLLQNLHLLWNSSTLCDVSLVAGGKEIPAHRAILAAASPFFRAMFTSNLREASESKVEMHGIEFTLLQDIVKFIYTSELKITDENVYDLMAAADILQFPALRSACIHFLFNTLHPSNCLSVLTAAQRWHGYQDLADAALRCACKHLCEVVQHEEFKAAPAHILKAVFEERVLNIPDEGFLLKTIIAWVNYDSTERLKQLDSLSSCIHFLQVPIDTLIVSKQEPVLENTKLRFQIIGTLEKILAERYDLGVRTRWATSYKEDARRMLRFNDDQEVILALGGESSGMALGSVECYTLGYENWKCVIPTAVQNAGGACEDTRVIPTMRTGRCFFGIAFSSEKVYVAGGAMPNTPTATAEVFSIGKNEWTALPSLPLPVVGTRLSFLDGQLFACGGQTGTSNENILWALDERSSLWKPHAPMSFDRSFHGLVNVAGCLYALGGKTGDGTILNTMECYDPMENKWIKVASMHEAKYDFGCASVDQYIYVMGGYDGSNWLRTVERYNTMSNQWTLMSPMSVGRASFGVTVSDSRIYCIGGFNGINYLNTVEKFNPRTNRWHCVQAMQNRRYGVGAATVRIPVISKEEP